MKKLLCCVMTLVMACAFFGCGNEEEATSEISGLVKSYETDSIIIITDADEVLTFALSDPEIQCENGVEADKNVVLVYTGAIDGTDTSGATVVTIKDGEPIEETSAAFGDDVKHIGGTVEEATADYVTIKDHEGESLRFDTSKAEIHYKNGIKAGNYVTIKYKGDIEGTDTSGVTVISIYDFSANEQHEQENNIKKITGTVGDGTSMNTLVLETTKGNMNFNITDAEKYIKNGLVVGNEVTVKYKGEIKGTDTSGVKVISVFDNAANEEAKKNSGTDNKDSGNKNTGADTDTKDSDSDNGGTAEAAPQTITGSVAEASMNTTTITTTDGNITFYTGDAEHYYKNGIQVGNVVTITYTGTINGTDAENVTVISVTDEDANLSDDNAGGSGDGTSATSSLSGTVGEDTSKSALELVLSDGTTQMFTMDDNVVESSDGLEAGDSVTVTYTGELGDVTPADKVVEK